LILFFFFFNDTATTEIYTLSLHDALPISCCSRSRSSGWNSRARKSDATTSRSEEHTSELQSLTNLVCRLLLEKKIQLTIDLSLGHTTHHRAARAHVPRHI